MCNKPRFKIGETVITNTGEEGKIFILWEKTPAEISYMVSLPSKTKVFDEKTLEKKIEFNIGF